MERLRQFFCNDWAIQRKELDNVLSLLSPCIMSGNLKAAEDILKEKKITAKATSVPNMARYWELDDINLPDNSIAVIRLDGMLYAWETDYLIDFIADAENNPKIAGLLFVIDGPGGHATRVDVAAAAIRDCTKPTATLVTGMMCSAHYWLGTSAGRVFAVSELCTVGSVGAMTEFMSFKNYFKNLGIELRDIYPDTSDLKNEEWRAMEEGDDSLTKKHLEKLHKLFAEAVAQNIGIPYDPELEIFRGRVFYADEALKAGYIDAIGSLKDALTWILTEATSREAKKLYQ